MTRQPQHPRLLYVEKAMTMGSQPADADEAEADEGIEEGWGGRRGSAGAAAAAFGLEDDGDEEGLDASDSGRHGRRQRQRQRRRPKALPVQLLVPSAADEGWSDGMMLGLPYRLQAPSAPSPPQPTAAAVALSPLERATAALAATPRGPNSPPPMASAATAADSVGTAGGAPAPGPQAAGGGDGGGGLANVLMMATGRRPAAGAAAAASSTISKVALVATPDPEAAFDAMAIRRLQALLCLAAVAQVLAVALLLFPPGGPTTMDPSLVDPSAPHNGPYAPPSPFQQPSPTHSPRAFAPIFGVGAAIAALGPAAALRRSPLGLKLYSLAAFLHLLCAAPLSPTPILAPALAAVVVPIALAERLYARLVPSCVVVASSGLARRFR